MISNSYSENRYYVKVLLFNLGFFFALFVLIFSNTTFAQQIPSNLVNQRSPQPPGPQANQLATTPYISTIVSMNQLDNSRKINVGDIINFRVIEDRDPPLKLVVTDSGELEVPYIGRVKARGKTCKALAKHLKALMEKDFYHKATVLIALDSYGRKSRGKVYLVGQVKGAGVMELPIDEKITVTKAILASGGMGDFADKRRVKLVRKRSPDDKNPKTIIVDVKRILEEGKTGIDPELQSDDLIIVPQRLINF